MEKIDSIKLQDNQPVQTIHDENKKIVLSKSNTFDQVTTISDIKRNITFRNSQIANLQDQNTKDNALLAQIVTETGLQIN